MEQIRAEPGQAATHHLNQGSWWPEYVAWLAERSGTKKDAPDSLGGAGMPPLEPAPGGYVLEH